MAETGPLATIDALADLSASVSAARGWLSRVHPGHELTERERTVVTRHLAEIRDGSAAVLRGAHALGLGPAEGPQDVAGEADGGTQPPRLESASHPFP
jgi:hypothetical protein